MSKQDDNKLLRPEQIRISTYKIMTYKKRLEWLKSSELGRLYGFKQD
jgi:hypothetical protein